MDHKQSPTVIHLFAGAGGGLLGGILLQWRTICAVELDPFCREVLVSRQNDGTISPFPIWDDVCTFDGKPWRGTCDILCGGFPCQNVSPLGDRKGIRGEKSGLWSEFARIIGEVRPKLVFIENSSDLTKLGLDKVLHDLATLGYDAEWDCMSAAELGAPHIRDRIWILGKKRGEKGTATTSESCGGDASRATTPRIKAPCKTLQFLANSNLQRWEELRDAEATATRLHSSELPRTDSGRRFLQHTWWENEPRLHRVVDGVAYQVDQLRALGNGQVPYVAARVYTELLNRFDSPIQS